MPATAEKSKSASEINAVMAVLEEAIGQVDSMEPDALLRIRGLFKDLFREAFADNPAGEAAMTANLDRATKQALSAKLPSGDQDRLEELQSLMKVSKDDALLQALLDEVKASLRAQHQEAAKKQEAKAHSTATIVRDKRKEADDKPKAPQSDLIAPQSPQPVSSDDDEEALDPKALLEQERLEAEKGKTPYQIFEKLLLERAADVFRCFSVNPEDLNDLVQDEPLPFYLNPAFPFRLHDFMMGYIVPDVMNHKYIDTRLISEVYRLEDLSMYSQFEDLLGMNGKGKDVLQHVWKHIWQDWDAALRPDDNKKISPELAKKQKAKRMAWKSFAKGLGAEEGIGPTIDDLAVLQSALFWPESAVVEGQKKSVFDSITQEMAGECSEGWVARFLGDLCLKEEDFYGDMMALWSYFVKGDELIKERDSGAIILKSFLASQGKTMHERRQHAGLVLRFAKQAQVITDGWR